MNPRFFATPADLQSWFAQHASTESELLVGFYKTHSGQPSITWPESVDEALCVGWIDGIRRRIDDVSYSIRFTPRKPRSTWSAVNMKRVTQLTQAGRMQPAGLKAFEARSDKNSAIYAYEQDQPAQLTTAETQQFKADIKAWDWFQAAAPWYKKTALHWVVSAKKVETRQKRLATLINDSAHGINIASLRRSVGSK